MRVSMKAAVLFKGSTTNLMCLIRHLLTLYRFTRSGTPTPISPDFDNLKSQWATLNPSGVDSSAYAATVTTTPPACPSSTAGTSAWTIDPSAKLPTMGQPAVSGMSSGPSISIPSGSITISGPVTESGSGSQTPSGSAPNLPQTGGQSSSASGSGSGSASSTSQGAGIRTVSTPIHINNSLILQAFIALAGVSLSAMIFL